MPSPHTQDNTVPSPMDPHVQPNPNSMKMSLDYIAPISKESGPRLPPFRPSATETVRNERPTLPNLSQCKLDIRIKLQMPINRPQTTDEMPRPPKLLLPSTRYSPRSSPIARNLRVEPYSRFRDRHSYRSSSSSASSRCSDTPSISPKPSPQFTHVLPFRHLQGPSAPSAAAKYPVTPTPVITIQRPLSQASSLVSFQDSSNTSPMFPINMAPASSRSSTSSSKHTSERPEYDSEELFAIAFLRLAKPGAVPWKEVKTAFMLLFPPDTPRRTSAPRQAAKNLLPTYSERDVGGLECRYYRIRTHEAMGKVRKHRRNSDCVSELEKDALRNMQRELVKEWIKIVDQSLKLEWGLVLRPGESDRSLLDRAVEVYEQKSQFWIMLMRVRSMAVSGAFASRD